MRRSSCLLDGGSISSLTCTGLPRATTVLNKVTWPNEVVYTPDGNPTAYQDILIPLFIKLYLIVMDTEEGLIRQKVASHLKDLISDAQVYGWDWT